MRALRRRAAILAIWPLLIVTACAGGSDDDAGGPAAEPTAGESLVEDAAGSTSDDGQIELGGDIPDYFPSDFYLPEDMTVRSVSRGGGMIALTGTFDEGDVDEIQTDMVAGLEAAGYELLSNDDLAAFAKNGVGRVRVRTSLFLDELTVQVDIDEWTDEQLDELRALFADEVVVPGRATAVVDGVTFEAEGECSLSGPNRAFYANDVSITVQIDESQDPTLVYADVTGAEGVVYLTEFGADNDYDATDSELSVSGDMVEFNNEAAGPLTFTVTATCDV
jgi:hypothetical protein